MLKNRKEKQAGIIDFAKSQTWLIANWKSHEGVKSNNKESRKKHYKKTIKCKRGFQKIIGKGFVAIEYQWIFVFQALFSSYLLENFII